MAKDRVARFQLLLTLAEQRVRQVEQLLAEAQQRVGQAERGLQQLQAYQLEYQQQFVAAGRQGLSVGGVQQYQGFIGRLGGACEQQRQALLQSRAQLEQLKRHWQQARAHAKAMAKLLQQAEAEAGRLAEKRLQQQIDEVAQRRRSTFI